MENAAKLGKLIVVINSDEWLKRKKGCVFQPWEARAELVKGLRCVTNVISCNDDDGTVCEALKHVVPDVFCNGGDRGASNTPEIELCKKLGIVTAFGVGGDFKTDSSSEIAKRDTVKRKWGTYEVLFDGGWIKVKRMVILPKVEHTPQRHFAREEYWFFKNSMRYIARAEWHSIHNSTMDPLEFIEVQIGDCREDDIERKVA
jgi:D-beta-D-heptose 7-phosphate kinase/D-beta-D-heptose 1-phosphate adenosyltransferase